MLTMGIDSGSAMTKAVLFDGQEIVDFRMEPSGSTPGRVIHRLYEELRTPDTAFVVATGYGRENIGSPSPVIWRATSRFSVAS